MKSNYPKTLLAGWLTLALIALMFVANSVLAAGAQHTESGVYRFGAGTLVAGAEASITTNNGGANFTLHTSELTPGDAVTVWWIIFNNPEYCDHGTGVPNGALCGGLDLSVRGGDPLIESSVLYAAGHVIGGSGSGNYGGHLSVGDNSGANFGPGLLNPQGAEIHMVVRTHGPAIPGQIPEQIHTFNGACDVNACADLQFAVFVQ